MKHPEQRRTLRLEFRPVLIKILKKRIDAWIKKPENGGWTNGTWAKLKNGEPVLERHIRRVAEYITKPHHRDLPSDAHEDIDCVRQIWSEIILRRTGKTIEELPVDAVVDCISYDQSVDSAQGQRQDAFSSGWSFMQKLFAVTFNRPDKCYGFCKRESDVCKVVNWMYINSARLNRAPDLSPDDAVDIAAQEVIRWPIRSYQGRAIEWRLRSPWSLLFARGDNGTPVGACISLPVSAQFYDRVRKGEIPSYNCRASDLATPSAHLIVECCTGRPSHLPCTTRQPDFHLLVALLCQMAYLTSVPGLPDEVPMRLLGVVGTPENAERARAWGFLPTGARCPRTGVEYHERIMHLNPQSPDWTPGFLWIGLQRLLKLLHSETQVPLFHA